MLIANDVLDHAKKSLSFKIHLIIVGALCCAAFGVWGFISLFVVQWPWFIYMFCIGAATISLHYYIGLQQPRQFLQAHIVLYGLINVSTFLTWMMLQKATEYTWFLYVLFGLGIPLGIHAVFDKYRTFPCL